MKKFLIGAGALLGISFLFNKAKSAIDLYDKLLVEPADNFISKMVKSAIITFTVVKIKTPLILINQTGISLTVKNVSARLYYKSTNQKTWSYIAATREIIPVIKLIAYGQTEINPQIQASTSLLLPIIQNTSGIQFKVEADMDVVGQRFTIPIEI